MVELLLELLILELDRDLPAAHRAATHGAALVHRLLWMLVMLEAATTSEGHWCVVVIIVVLRFQVGLDH